VELSAPSGVGLAGLLGLVLAQDDSPHAEIAAEALAVAQMSVMAIWQQVTQISFSVRPIRLKLGRADSQYRRRIPKKDGRRPAAIGTGPRAVDPRGQLRPNG